MELMFARVALTPSLVLLISLVARRAGPDRGGQLLGAPTASGPFLLLVYLDGGSTSATHAALGGVAGQLVAVCFCLAYGRLASVLRPAWTLLAALGCAAAGGVVGALSPTVWLTVVISVAAIGAGLLTWPQPAPLAPAPRQQPAGRSSAWEIPLRMALSGITVLGAVVVAGSAGPFVGGVLSSLPVVLAVMAPSVHRTGGAAAAAAMMRAAMTSVMAALGFLLVVSAVLVSSGPVLAFLLALVAMILIDYLLRGAVARLAHA